MADDPIDTGFDAVIAGEKWEAPPDEVTIRWTSPDIHIAVSPEAVDEVTATVNEPVGLTAAGVQAAKALVKLPADLDWPALAALAREVAMNIKERSVILKDFKLTESQYDFLENYNEFYRSALAAACKEWHAPLSTQQRIEVEAAAILEDSLLILGARMQNKGEGLPGVIEAAKFFGKIARVGERESSQAAPGERFTINIDLGGDKSLTATVSTPTAPSPALAAVRALSNDGEAE